MASPASRRPIDSARPARTPTNVRQDLKEYDAEALATCLHDDVIRPWAAFNHGDPDLAPYPCWDTKPPEDRRAKAETLDKLGDAIGKLQAVGVQVDAVAIAEEHGVPLISRESRAPGGAGAGVGADRDRRRVRYSR